jgi:hypothetical protein
MGSRMGFSLVCADRLKRFSSSSTRLIGSDGKVNPNPRVSSFLLASITQLASKTDGISYYPSSSPPNSTQSSCIRSVQPFWTLI